MTDRMRRIVAAAVTAAMVAGLVAAIDGRQASSFVGRWEFTYEAPAGGGRAGGRGRGGAPVTRTLTLDLWLDPSGALAGTLDPGPGRAPGNNPQQPVELRDVTVDGPRLSFSAWQFDNRTNRVRYTGTLQGDALTLTLTRDLPDGPERIETSARRVGR